MTDIIHSFKCDLGHSTRWAVPHSHILHQNTAPPWKGVEFTLHTVSAGKWLQDKTYDCSISDSAAQEFVKITGKGVICLKQIQCTQQFLTLENSALTLCICRC